MYKGSEPVITYENIHESALKLMNTDLAVIKLVGEKCEKEANTRPVGERIIMMSASAIDIILHRLGALDQPPHRPEALDFENGLLDAFHNADDELLARCWNESMLDGGWEFVRDGITDPEFDDCRGHKEGWLVRGVERVSASVVIEIMMADCMFTIDYWINRFTKALYLNTSTEEWAKAFRVDMSDEEAVAEMTLRIRTILMG